MPLFLVTIERTLILSSADDLEAAIDAGSFERDAALDSDADSISVVEIQTPADVPKEWLDALPYGGDGKGTVRQILETENK